MQQPETLLLSLVLLLTLAKILEAPLRKYRLHPIPAHVLAGIILGPYVLGYVYPSLQLEGVAYVGLLLLLFYTGLNTDFRELRRHSGSIIVMGGLGVTVTFLLTYASMIIMGWEVAPSIFISAVLSNTATETVAAMVTGKGDPTTRSLLVGASFTDDILAVFIIGLLPGLTGGHINVSVLLWVSVKTGVFLTLVFAVGELLVKKYKGIYRAMSSDYFWFSSISVILA
jgi:Kef-type K+ transport system membrane component KefB